MYIQLLAWCEEFPDEPVGRVLNTPDYIAKPLIEGGKAIDYYGDCNKVPLPPSEWSVGARAADYVVDSTVGNALAGDAAAGAEKKTTKTGRVSGLEE